MKLIFMISLRNLLRQKRRNILLGMAIAIGVMLLIVATSFSAGISDVMFNKIVSKAFGHVILDFHEKGGGQAQIFRDKERIMPVIKSIEKEVLEYNEALRVFGRVIGNGKADNMVVVGIDFSRELSEESKKDMEEQFKMLDGKWEGIKNKSVENGVIVCEKKAKDLNIKTGDILRMRFPDLFGRNQAVKLNVVGIFKTDNMFMESVMFIELTNIKTMLGMKEYEMGPLQLTIKDPKKNAKPLADKIHSMLKPGIAELYSEIRVNGKTQNATILGLKITEASKKLYKEKIILTEGKIEDLFEKSGVLIAKPLAEVLGVKTGDEIESIYTGKHEGIVSTKKYTIKGIYNPSGITSDNVILLNEVKFYDTYLENIPQPITKYTDAFVPQKDSVLYNYFATEWTLLDRSKTTEEMMKKMKDIGKKKYKGVTVDVNSMYESASQVLQLEMALNMITIVASIILFFIILIGVINTLRMTIRERTREIGTMRAVGMQKTDVRNAFLMETLLLAFFSSVAGTAVAFILMGILGSIKIDAGGNPIGMILVSGHIHFLPTVVAVLTSIVAILAAAVITAYFPARRAANLSAADALRHYE